MSETILVVDDEENIRHTLRGVLADEGFDVLEAPNGRRALELLAHTAPRLGDRRRVDARGGRHRARRAHARAGARRADHRDLGTRTIETAVRVIRLGAFDYLEKPFPLDALPERRRTRARQHERRGDRDRRARGRAVGGERRAGASVSPSARSREACS
jgi:two-component system nitrogen regulation response regulator NtrX